MQVQLNQISAKRMGEIFLTFVSIVYICGALLWLAPDCELKNTLLKPIRVGWLFCGLKQRWALFAPVVRQFNFHTNVTLAFADGSVMNWEVPRMDRLNLFDRFRLEKFRKFGIDHLPWPEYKECWPDFARYVGRLYYTPTDKPETLSLHLYWVNIPEPGTKGSERANLPEHTQFHTVFTYKYSDRDFQ